METKKSIFEILSQLDVNKELKEKSRLKYLPWARAWAEVKKIYPEANYEILMFNGLPYINDPLTGYMVFTSVTIDGLTHQMHLAVMDGANNAMKSVPYTYTVADMQWDQKLGKKVKVGDITKKVEAATMFDINKSLMRCLTKNLAMHGLGLYVFEGEDNPDIFPNTPEETTAEKQERLKKEKEKPAAKKQTTPEAKPAETKPAEPKATPIETPKAPVQSAAQTKAPVVVRELVVDSEDWAKVLKYIATNKSYGLEAITKALSVKYIISDDVKAKIKESLK